jgi:hypothetical protein
MQEAVGSAYTVFSNRQDPGGPPVIFSFTKRTSPAVGAGFL